jgi:hypothetical protein
MRIFDKITGLLIAIVAVPVALIGGVVVRVVAWIDYKITGRRS